jgi:predicted nucleotidyltransferase
MSEKNDIKSALRYINLISEKIPVKEVILFGSRARGNAGEHSDIDLAVISPKFSDKTHLKDSQFLWTEAARFDSRIEPLPFSTAEMRKVDPRSFLAEILRSGKTIYKSK